MALRVADNLVKHRRRFHRTSFDINDGRLPTHRLRSRTCQFSRVRLFAAVDCLPDLVKDDRDGDERDAVPLLVHDFELLAVELPSRADVIDG